VFLDPDFLNDAEISAIRVHLRQIQDYLHGFSGPLRLKYGLGQIGERVVRCWPNELVFTGWGKNHTDPVKVRGGLD